VTGSGGDQISQRPRAVKHLRHLRARPHSATDRRRHRIIPERAQHLPVGSVWIRAVRILRQTLLRSALMAPAATVEIGQQHILGRQRTDLAQGRGQGRGGHLPAGRQLHRMAELMHHHQQIRDLAVKGAIDLGHISALRHRHPHRQRLPARTPPAAHQRKDPRLPAGPGYEGPEFEGSDPRHRAGPLCPAADLRHDPQCPETRAAGPPIFRAAPANPHRYPRARPCLPSNPRQPSHPSAGPTDCVKGTPLGSNSRSI